MSGRAVREHLRNGVSARVLSIALGIPLVVGVPSAWAGGSLPTDGHYVAGVGAIAKKGANGLTISQGTGTGIIDWSSFSIGKGNSVQFNNGSGATLNRVTGGDLSTIAGSLKATGSLYLINPQGVIVSGTGKVLTGGSFVASSRDESDSDFLAGKRTFSGTSNGNVTNAGTIKSVNGDVTLIGSSVSNSGAISANNGTASLNAGNEILLAPAGSRILVNGGTGSASNSGTLQAVQAQINAAGGNVYALAGNNGGIVRATGTATINGHVWLTSGSGNVEVSGSVSANNADGSGGAITARASNIVISGNIDASATQSTKLGGNVSVVAADTTELSGTIAARGGDHGKGGSVETSGQHLHVADSAKVDTLSADGLSGDWLIDPNDFTIAASGGDITGTALSNELGTSDITIHSSDGGTAGNGDIFVNDSVSWSSTHNLTLDAYRDIDINAPVTIAGAGGLVLINADTTQSGAHNSSAAGDLYFGTGGNVAFTDVISGNTQGSLAINGASYTLANSIAQLASDIGSTPSADIALANSYDASVDGTYTDAPVQTVFEGTFEGLGNVISNLTVSDADDSSNVGLFAEIDSSGKIADLGIVNATISGAGSSKIGALAGIARGDIANTFSSGFVSGGGDSDVGGLVGENFGSIGLAHSSANVSGYGGSAAGTGGLIGHNQSGLAVSGSYATGDVSADAGGDVGGFVGWNQSGEIDTSYSTSTVTANSTSVLSGSAGGFVGDNDDTISDSYATGNVSAGNDEIVGGFAGENGGSIQRAVAMGSVTAGISAQAGGLAAQNGGAISQSFAAGNVTVGEMGSVGGFVAWNGGSIVGAGETGNVRAGSGGGGTTVVAGGFAATNVGAITEAYATGIVDAGSFADVGGFVGFTDGIGTIDQAYELGPSLGRANSIVGKFAGVNETTQGLGGTTAVYFETDGGDAGVGSGNGIVRGGALAPAEMGDYHNFDGWTFGTTPGASGWVIIDTDASLNDASAGGATTPMLLGEYSTKVGTAHQLQLMELDPSASYTLITDIDAIGVVSSNDVWIKNTFVPVGGNGNSSFSGTFDGANRTISNLTINDTDSNDVGLFGTTNGVIKNVGLIDATINGLDNNVGALVGRADGAQISDVFVTGSVQGGSGDVGGLVGALGTGASISGSWSNVVVYGGNTATGGIAGIVENGSSIDHSHADGSIYADGAAGGVAGENDGAISFSYAAGAVVHTTGGYSGGIAGTNSGTISDAYASENVSTDAFAAGGLVGSNSGDVENAFWNTDGVTSGPISTFGSDSGTSSNVAGLSRTDMEKTSSFSGWTFGGLASGANWVLIGADGSVNNPTDAEGGTLPMLLGEYSTKISNAHQLQLMTLDLTQNYVLANDIDAGGTDANGVWGSDGFIAVGGNNLADTPFSGTLDGAGHKIDQLTIADNANAFVGLFGGLSADAAVSNVSLTSLAINHTSAGVSANNVGGIAGSSAGRISNVAAIGTITVDGIASVGGVVGSNSGDILDAQTSGEVEAQNDTDQTQGVGGLVGFNSGDIQGSSVLENVTADGGASAGGLVGFNSGATSGTAHILSSHAFGNVTVGSNAAAGGLVGISTDGSIESSFAASDLDGTALYAGGLVGLVNGGSVTTSFATGNVASSGNLAVVGAFVGLNDGAISQSYATGNANSGLAGGMAGGFAGENDASIADSYAMGGASADTAGGFVGENTGTIATSYSLGIASGTNAGGFAGADEGTTTNSFWDTDTSGLLADSPAGGTSQATAKTTVQAQQGLATGFDSSIWGDTWGQTFAYLKWQFDSNDEPTPISGTVYLDQAGTRAGPGVSVSLADRYGDIDAVTTYADGSFYELLPFVPDTGVVASAGAGVTFSDVGDSIYSYSGMVVDDSGGLYLQTRDQNLSTLAGNFDAVTQLTSFAQALNVYGASDLTLDTEGNGFTIDQALDVGAGTLTLNTNTYVNETNGGYIAADTLNGLTNWSMALTGANKINNLGDFTGAFNFALTNAQSLTISGDVNIRRQVDSTVSDQSILSLTTTGTGSGISVDRSLNADSVTLNSAAQIGEGTSGVINAATLAGSSTNDISLTKANHVGSLGAFTTTGVLSFTDAQTLNIDGLVSTNGAILSTTGTGSNIAFNDIFKSNNGHTVTVNSAGAITQSASSVIATATLTGSSVHDTSLIGSNLISTITPFNVGGVLQFTDAQNFTTLDTINANGAILKTVGAGHIVTFYGAFHSNNGHTMTVNSSGAISEGKAGYISASSFTGSAVGAVSLTGPNLISVLGSVTASGGLSLTNAENLTIGGVLNTGGAILKTTGAGHTLAINAAINDSGHTVNLNSSGAITQGTAAAIAASTLTGSSVGATTLAAANRISVLGAFTAGGNFSLTNGQALTVMGPLSATPSTAVVSLTTNAGNLTFTGKVTGGTVTLKTAAEATQSTASSITTNKLNVTARTGINLVGANHIKAVGIRTTASGPNVIKGIGS